VDLDAYVAAHAERWEQLRTLTRRRRLDGPASDELVDAYQQVATNLSVVRSAAPDPSLIGYLSSVPSHARTRASGTRTMSWAAVVVFFAATFPAALYRTRRWWLTTMGVNLGVATVIAWWLLAHPRVLAAMTTPREVRRLVNQQFSGYYHQSKIAVQEGQMVNTGDLLGYVGGTGFADGPHLHWEVRIGNRYVDPDEWTKTAFGV